MLFVPARLEVARARYSVAQRKRARPFGSGPGTRGRGSGREDFDSAWLGLGNLGNGELEYAVLELRLDRVGLHVVRQREGPNKLAADALHAGIVAVGFALLD